RDTVRTISRLDIAEQAAELVIDVEGDGFLRHMVRAIVGTLVEVGAGRRPPGWVADVLAARHRAAAGDTAPARGLTLQSVSYRPSNSVNGRGQSVNGRGQVLN